MKKINTRDYDLEHTTGVANVPSYPIVSQLVDLIQSHRSCAEATKKTFAFHLLQTPFEKIENREEVKETVRKLKSNVNVLGNRSERMESLLPAIVGHLNIEKNEDEPDKDFVD